MVTDNCINTNYNNNNNSYFAHLVTCRQRLRDIYLTLYEHTHTHTDTQTESVFALRSQEKRVFIGTATVSSRCVAPSHPLSLSPSPLTASLRARADCILTVKRVRLSVRLQVRVSTDSLTGLAPARPMVAASTTTTTTRRSRRRTTTTTIATVTK